MEALIRSHFLHEFPTDASQGTEGDWW